MENFLSYSLIVLLTSLLSILIIFLNIKFGYKFIDNTQGVQKFHTSPTPRVGGLGILITFFIAGFFFINSDKKLWFIIGFSALPVFVFGILEDFWGNINPRLRIIASFVTGMIFILLSSYVVEKIGVKGFDAFLSIYFVSFLFTSFAIAGVINSINIIDGFNGLASGSLIIMFIAFAVIGHHVGDLLIFNFSLVMMLIFFGFLLINFPKGYIFLGDGGAYFGGFVLATIAIMLPYRNSEISSWVSLLICLYPITETTFSIFRKVKRKGHHPSQPDGLHLHMLVYRSISKKISKSKTIYDFRNPITGSVIWILPILTTLTSINFYHNIALVLFSIILFIIFYILIYQKVSLNFSKFWRSKFK